MWTLQQYLVFGFVAGTRTCSSSRHAGARSLWAGLATQGTSLWARCGARGRKDEISMPRPEAENGCRGKVGRPRGLQAVRRTAANATARLRRHGVAMRRNVWHRPRWLSQWRGRRDLLCTALQRCAPEHAEAEAARSSAKAAEVQLAISAACASTSPSSPHTRRPSQLRAAGVHTSAAFSRCNGGGDGADGGRHGRRLRRHGPQ